MSESTHKRDGKRLPDGARLILLDLPSGTEFGIDNNIWSIGPNFRGIKNIPPGIHFIFYSAVSKEGQAAPRTGFFYNFLPQEIVVRKWDAHQEDLIEPPTSEDDFQRVRSNLREVNRYLGPYPYDNYKKWVSLSNHMTPKVVGLLQPSKGKVTAVTQFVSEPSTSQSRKQAADLGQIVPRDKDGLPNMNQSPETIINYSNIPLHSHPRGATPAEITHCGIDASFTLESIIADRYSCENTKGCEEGLASMTTSTAVDLPRHQASELNGDSCDGEGILGEMQFAFICFLLGHNYDSFEHWKLCVRLMCTSGDSLLRRPKLFTKLITVLHFQLREVPADLFVDIVEGENFLTQMLTEFFSRVQDEGVSPELHDRALAFRSHVTRKFGWDFTTEPDDCAPVIVEIVP